MDCISDQPGTFPVWSHHLKISVYSDKSDGWCGLHMCLSWWYPSSEYIGSYAMYGRTLRASAPISHPLLSQHFLLLFVSATR